MAEERIRSELYLRIATQHGVKVVGDLALVTAEEDPPQDERLFPKSFPDALEFSADNLGNSRKDEHVP
jgi:hypothetical protein